MNAITTTQPEPLCDPSDCLHKYDEIDMCAWCWTSRLVAEEHFCLRCGETIDEHTREMLFSLCERCEEARWLDEELWLDDEELEA